VNLKKEKEIRFCDGTLCWSGQCWFFWRAFERLRAHRFCQREKAPSHAANENRGGFSQKDLSIGRNFEKAPPCLCEKSRFSFEKVEIRFCDQ
jgi:hypothetical protein